MGDEVDVTRTADDLDHGNTLVLPDVKVRFQIAPGTASGLGIDGAEYVLLISGTEIGRDRTNADGEIALPLRAVMDRTLTVRIFETEYAFEIHPGLQAIDTRRGQQKRLDIAGYMTGYQRSAVGSDEPDDGTDGTRTQQSILNLQADSDIGVDGDIGPQTLGAIRTAMNE